MFISNDSFPNVALIYRIAVIRVRCLKTSYTIPQNVRKFFLVGKFKLKVLLEFAGCGQIIVKSRSPFLSRGELDYRLKRVSVSGCCAGNPPYAAIVFRRPVTGFVKHAIATRLALELWQTDYAHFRTFHRVVAARAGRYDWL